jgi:rhodanese-related sulfurtransferase
MRSKAFFLVIFSSFLYCCLTAQQLSPDDFSKQVQQPGIQVLDVRTAGEYKAGHIAQSLQADWNDQGQFKDRVQHVDKSKPVYVYCAVGGRSKAAAAWMRENGFTQVFELSGGLTKWKSENKPVEGMPDAPAISLQEYTAKVSAAPLVLADFSADFCPPCRKMAPVLQQLQNDLPNKFSLVKIDAGMQTALMKEVKVTEMPTFILYKNGKEVWRKQGVVELGELSRILHL